MIRRRLHHAFGSLFDAISHPNPGLARASLDYWQRQLRLCHDTLLRALGADVEPLIEITVARGGNIRVGLEDAPLGCEMGNRALVERAQRRIASAGGSLASAAEVRNVLKAAVRQ